MSRWQPIWLKPELQQEATYALVHFRQSFLTMAGATAQEVLLKLSDVQVKQLPVISQQGLGYWDGQTVYLYELEYAIDILGAHWSNLRGLMAHSGDAEYLQMLCFAAQVGTWASQHRFCGSCGAPMQPLHGERAMCCAHCHTCHYPRLSPCMIALVTRGPEILLARGPHHPAEVYSTLAGFVEPGETIEQCVLREVQEEVGLKVKEPRYIASQSWPFPHSLMLGFHVQYQSGQIQPQPGEIEEADWFSVYSLPELPGHHTIARYLIEHYTAQYLGNPLPSWPSY